MRRWKQQDENKKKAKRGAGKVQQLMAGSSRFG